MQLVKSAASRIKFIDQEKARFLSRIVARIENSHDLFYDLKRMERVVELEELATKLISIYKKLNKTRIELEKISYQFINDRDSVQSIFRRFCNGEINRGIVKKKRPKIVFDDVTNTIYEIKDLVDSEAHIQEEKNRIEPKIHLNEFLEEGEQKIVQVIDENSAKLQTEDINKSDDTLTIDNNSDVQYDEIELNNGIAKKSLEKISRHKKETIDNLVLPLEFENESKKTQEEHEQKIKSLSESEIVSEAELTPEIESESQEELINQKEKVENETTSANSQQTELSSIPSDNLEPAGEDLFQSNEKINTQEEKNDILEKEKETEKATEVFEGESKGKKEISAEASTDILYLEFEKTLLENVLEVDDYLNKIQKESVSDQHQLYILQKAYHCYQLAQQIGFDYITDLIKVYWSALCAIRDKRLVPDRINSEYIRSTMIILVSLLKEREVDLESFISKNNQLKEKLKSLGYEV